MTRTTECRVHRCSNCPETVCCDVLETGEVELKQWTTTNRATLITQEECVEDYINLISEKPQQMTHHSYISKCQPQYLKKLKKEITNGRLIFPADVADN